MDLEEKFTTRIYVIGLVSGFLAGLSTGILASIYYFYRINKTTFQSVLLKALLQKALLQK